MDLQSIANNALPVQNWKNRMHVLDSAENCLSNGIKTKPPAAVGSEKTDFEVLQNMVKLHRVF